MKIEGICTQSDAAEWEPFNFEDAFPPENFWRSFCTSKIGKKIVARKSLYDKG